MDHHSYEQVGNQLELYYTHIIEDNKKRENYGLMKKDIQRIWKNLFQKCEKKQLSHSLKRKVWFLYYIEKIVKENNYKTVAIWGAGYHSVETIEWCLLLELEVLQVIDSYKKGMLNGYIINKPDECNINAADIIFISIGNVDGCKEVMKVLEMQGRVRNKNYFLVRNNPCISINENKIGEEQ